MPRMSEKSEKKIDEGGHTLQVVLAREGLRAGGARERPLARGRRGSRIKDKGPGAGAGARPALTASDIFSRRMSRRGRRLRPRGASGRPGRSHTSEEIAVKYLMLKHYRGGPTPVHGQPPMDRWTPEEVDAHVRYMRDFAARLEETGEFVDSQALAPGGAFVRSDGEGRPTYECIMEPRRNLRTWQKTCLLGPVVSIDRNSACATLCLSARH